MAKCTICNARKGKRKCKATATLICSQCCGEARSSEKCDGCSFFVGASINKNYRKAPYYSLQEMADSPEKEKIAMVIETTLCDIWKADTVNVNDITVQRLVEMLLDKYHFGEEEQAPNDQTLLTGYRHITTKINKELAQVHPEQLVKALGAIYRSIQRRSGGSCSYLNFVSRFTG